VDPAEILAQAHSVIIIPGYGMALAQAQHLVKQLADKLKANGAEVSFAIHPVAGRMPGHMNVLLAEADVPYEELHEMEEINPKFQDCDVAVIIGSNDVVNPAAREAEGTPIYGMPVLAADQAKHIIICNYDLKPGYAGVENPLYTMEDKVSLLLGDAKETLASLLAGIDRAKSGITVTQEPEAVQEDSAGAILAKAHRVIIIPGYGMALAQAQHQVKQLADLLEANEIQVEFAIHPVAGRMPGHMNVLLAEADVPYEKLHEMEEINPKFKDCDVAIIIGANDVVNPAAREAEGTPIYGMPVLSADEAKHVIVCNYDLKPGYAGVENPLYSMEDKVTLLLGDAKETLTKLSAEFESAKHGVAGTELEEGGESPAQLLREAKKVIIIPGYGMALAQAQHLVKQLADKLKANGAEVSFAIHPVAGRMPGHMNVLLAEADVSYEELHEMDEINPSFAACDVTVIIGANDVVNPAARDAEGTPIYGMPVLNADQAKHVIICNYDLKPGYAGVDNPLYSREQGVTLLLGDAKETIQKLISEI
jgi:NAD/NADP transhydrogenase beta subunit